MDFMTLPPLTVLDIVGRDAARVLNNLCTAAVLTLNEGEGCEAFITEVRGRTLGHLCIYHVEERMRLIGAAGQADTVAAHIDRYTIREDAMAQDHSAVWAGLLLDGDCLRNIDPAFPLDSATDSSRLHWRRISLPISDPATDHSALASDDPAGADSVSPGGETGTNLAGAGDIRAADGVLGLIAYRVPWAGGGRWLVAGPTGVIQTLASWLRNQGAGELGEADFHCQRVLHRFPWFGSDLDDRNLPQEADRDAQAISFTKGCYLGQETVARLDALGQVQKKLVQWRIAAEQPPAPGAELSQDGRVVGRLTSVVADPTGAGYVALGFARRSHFDPGAEAQLQSEGGEVARATVV